MMTETVVNVEAPNNNASKPQQTESPVSWIKINLDYFRTTPGLLKVAEFILGILCMSLASPAYSGGVHFFLFVATTSFIATMVWIFIYLLGIREALTDRLHIDWILTELVNTGICSMFYIIAFVVQLIQSIHFTHHGTYIAAAVFGALNACVYSFATFILHLEWKSTRTTN